MAIPLGDGYASLGPCGEIVALTTNSTTTLNPLSRAVVVGTNGTLQATFAFATQSVTLTVYGGQWLPIRVKQVHAAPAGSFALW